MVNAAPTIVAVETDSAWVVILAVSFVLLPSTLLLRRLINRPGGIGSAALMSPELALNLAYFQPDGIHPNAKAQPLLLDTVWIQLTPLLRRK